MTTPEERAEWRREAESLSHDCPWHSRTDHGWGRILALLDDLDRVEALPRFDFPIPVGPASTRSLVVRDQDLRAALDGSAQ